jgi:GNAT superfamily N-acetyltransferase
MEESVADLEALNSRLADRSDAEAIARLHADSWRRHYRGAYSDAFLDGDVLADRIAVWTDRMRDPDGRHQTILAERGGDLVGFAHTIFEEDQTWGALLDNLHVARGRKRRGVGSQLLALTARAVIEREIGLYLWVLQQNVEARAFYEARGARPVDGALASPPGGVASRLSGSPVKLRYAWTDPTVLLGFSIGMTT